VANEAIYSRADDWILHDATWSVPVGSLQPSYDISVLQHLRPHKRLLFGSGTATVRATIGTSRSASVFALPVSNCTGAVLSIANNSGLSLSVPVPALPPDGVPLTAVIQFAPSSATQWDVVVSGNPDFLILGGAIWFGTARTFARNYHPSWTETEVDAVSSVTNEYLARYQHVYQARERSMAFQVPATDVQAADLLAWSRGKTASGSNVSLFWPNPLVNDARLGVFDGGHTVSPSGVINYQPTTLTFIEMGKGRRV
jgi:hypothetical protein